MPAHGGCQVPLWFGALAHIWHARDTRAVAPEGWPNEMVPNCSFLIHMRTKMAGGHCRSGKHGGSVNKARKYCVTGKDSKPKRYLSSKDGGVAVKTTGKKKRAGPN